MKFNLIHPSRNRCATLLMQMIARLKNVIAGAMDVLPQPAPVLIPIRVSDRRR
jgi:hypothetical protein